MTSEQKPNLFPAREFPEQPAGNEPPHFELIDKIKHSITGLF